jgi:hypothetical protein
MLMTSAGHVRVMLRGFALARFVVPRSFLLMSCGMVMLFSCLIMVICCLS